MNTGHIFVKKFVPFGGDDDSGDIPAYDEARPAILVRVLGGFSDSWIDQVCPKLQRLVRPY